MDQPRPRSSLPSAGDLFDRIDDMASRRGITWYQMLCELVEKEETVVSQACDGATSLPSGPRANKPAQRSPKYPGGNRDTHGKHFVVKHQGHPHYDR